MNKSKKGKNNTARSPNPRNTRGTGFAKKCKEWMRNQRPPRVWSDDTVALYLDTPEGKAAGLVAAKARQAEQIEEVADYGGLSEIWSPEIAERLLEEHQDMVAEDKPKTTELGYPMVYASLLN